MPYIAPDERDKFTEVLRKLPQMESKGQLEFCIFWLMKDYMHDKMPYRYSDLHDTVYAAIHCGDEFRRRYLDVREDDALKVNGGVYYGA